MANEKILIVDDEPAIRELVRLALESAGYTALYEAGDGESAIRLARQYQVDLVLLDLMLPGVDGLTVCRRLQNDEATRQIPVVMLTAKSEESDIVIGLELGACDYITKPFSRKVLVARVRACLRRRSEREDSSEIRYDGFVINSELHQAYCDECELDLTRSEFEILKLLTGHPGRVYTRNQIITKIKGDDYPVTERAVDVQIVNLRRKLGDRGEAVETVRGVGYRFKGGLAG